MYMLQYSMLFSLIAAKKNQINGLLACFPNFYLFKLAHFVRYLWIQFFLRKNSNTQV